MSNRRFSTPATGVSVMHKAKKAGSEKRAWERFDKMQDALMAEQERASGAGFWSKVGGGIGSLISGKWLTPLISKGILGLIVLPEAFFFALANLFTKTSYLDCSRITPLNMLVNFKLIQLFINKYSYKK